MKTARLTNMQIARKGNALVITIPDVNTVYGESQSGLSNMVATSHGITDIGEGLSLNLNLSRPNQAARDAEKDLRKAIAAEVRTRMAAARKAGNGSHVGQ